MPGKHREIRVVDKALLRVNQQVRQILKSPDPFLNRWLGQAVAAKGKQLRARLTLLSAALCGSVGPKVEQLAATFELFHYATLVHDDVIDHAARRRHSPSVNTLFGNEIAVLVGDFLFTRVMSVLFDSVPPRIQQQVLAMAMRVCQGEAHEHGVRGKRLLSQAEYLRIVENKTASLFSVCCQTSAELVQASPAQTRRLAEFGLALGMAFQIRDDILDIMGSSGKLGKSPGTDLKAGRMTLPIILGIKQLRGVRLKQLRQAMIAGPKGLASIREILNQSGSMAAAQAKADQYAQNATAALRVFPDSQARQELAALAYYAVAREA